MSIRGTEQAHIKAESTGARLPSTPLVWVDCEMTGLDLRADALVEIACVVTDAELQPFDDGVSQVIRPPDTAWDQMSDLVRKMHEDSGLIGLVKSGASVAAAESLVLDYVRSHVPQRHKAPLAGSSVHVDRSFLQRQMPSLDAYLHYRIVDVSSLKELVRRWYPKVYYNAPAKTGNHRALGDIHDSIAELNYYRRTVFAEPGEPAPEAGDGAVTGTL